MPTKSGSGITTSTLKRLGLPTHRLPPAPGEILDEDFRKPHGLTQEQLAAKLRTTVQTVNRIIKGKQAISPEMALKLADAFGTTPQLWMSLQMDYDLARAAWRAFGRGMSPLAERP